MASAMRYWLAWPESDTTRFPAELTVTVPRSSHQTPASWKSLGSACWLTVVVASVAPAPVLTVYWALVARLEYPTQCAETRYVPAAKPEAVHVVAPAPLVPRA